jgi:hypothetical protein
MEAKLPNPELPMLHILVGEPDDDCPICRAHSMVKKPADQDGIITVPITDAEIQACNCDLCKQAKPHM